MTKQPATSMRSKLITDINRSSPLTPIRTGISPEEFEKLRRTVHIYKRMACILGAILVVIAIGFFAHYLFSHSSNNDPVPLSVRKQVPFNVYFPDPAKLPAGFTLNTGSFSVSSQVVVYEIPYSANHRLVVTVQRKPSITDIQAFYKTRMPLTNTITTSIGTAAIGGLNNETIASLPTNTNAWILVTAPLDANQAQLRQVLQAMTKAN